MMTGSDSWKGVLALGLLGAVAACSSPPPPVTPMKDLFRVRLLVPTKPEVSWSDDGCAGVGAGIANGLLGSTHEALSSAGFDIVTSEAEPYDARAYVFVGLAHCNDIGQNFGEITVTIKPGSKFTVPFQNFGMGDGLYWPTVLARRIQESPQILALTFVAKNEVARNADDGKGERKSGVAPSVKGDRQGGDGAANTSLITGSPQRNAYAFVVGIDKYRDVPAAPNARADAEKFAALARSTLGLPDDQVRVALDDRAGIVDIRKGLKWLKTSVPAGGRAYFFFAGHGAPDASAGTPYLMPYDGDAKDLKESAIELQEVLATLGDTPGAQAIAIVDACFSGSGGRSVLPEGARPLVRVKTANAGAKVALFSASTGAEISGPDQSGKGGLFTSILVEGLGKAGADIDGNGDVTLGELGTWVVPRVKREASALGREQTPGLTLGAGLKADEVVLGAGLGKR